MSSTGKRAYNRAQFPQRAPGVLEILIPLTTIDGKLPNSARSKVRGSGPVSTAVSSAVIAKRSVC